MFSYIAYDDTIDISISPSNRHYHASTKEACWYEINTLLELVICQDGIVYVLGYH